MNERAMKGAELELSGDRKLREQFKKTMLEERFVALLLFDLDNFHQFNVEHGVEQGDRVLALIEQYIADQGWAGYRIGGDDFGLVVENGRNTFDDEEFSKGLLAALKAQTGFDLTVSGGGVWNPGDDFTLDPRLDEVVFSIAHQLLANAKKQGGNQIMWLPRGSVEASDVMRLMVRFYEELARVSAVLTRELKIESRIDFLTGLANRRGFEDVFRRMIEGVQRSQLPLALIYLDSDSLKQINDARGHEAGDRFLVDIARVLKQTVRGSDFISRWGADEFAVLMDNTSKEKADVLAHRIQHAIEMRTEGTVSVGVYCGVPSTPEEAIQTADQAMYRAKGKGKNRVELAD